MTTAWSHKQEEVTAGCRKLSNDQVRTEFLDKLIAVYWILDNLDLNNRN
jgi:hypothetical protein